MNGKKRPTAGSLQSAFRCCEIGVIVCYTSEGAVAHAARGAQCRDDGGDDAADDLKDGLPRFLFHGVRWFLSGLINSTF